jgi:hypothetical protein
MEMGESPPPKERFTVDQKQILRARGKPGLVVLREIYEGRKQSFVLQFVSCIVDTDCKAHSGEIGLEPI